MKRELVVPWSIAPTYEAIEPADYPPIDGLGARRLDLACQPAAVAHQLPAAQLVLLAPRLDATRGDAKTAVRRARRARVEAAARRELVGLRPWQGVNLQRLDLAIDHRNVAGVAEREPGGSRGGEVPAGRTVLRRGHEQRLAVPVEGQWHEIRRPVHRGTDHPRVGVVGEPVLGVAPALGAGAGIGGQ